MRGCHFTEKALSLLIVFYTCHEVETNQCYPCSCWCPPSEPTPCVNCMHQNLKTVPIFPLNFTNTIRTLALSRNSITVLGNGNFKNYINLERLYLSFNGMTNVSHGAFDGLKKLQILYMIGNQIKTLQHNSFKHPSRVGLLSVSSNDTSDISQSVFQNLKNLKVLYLENNLLNALQPLVFQDLVMLEVLSLSWNEISDISQGAFQGLKTLKVLRLVGNRISTLRPQIFQQLIMLKELHLDKNTIEDIFNGTFDGMRKLKSLYLRENLLHQLHPNMFCQLETLNLLNLRSNKILKIPKNAFLGLRKLKILLLDSNEIQTLPSHSFDHLEELEDLQLHTNKIQNISSNAFNNLHELKVLDLHGNKITRLEAYTFRYLENLEDIDLYDNKITTISKTAFFNLKRLRTLNLYENQVQELPAETFNGLESLKLLCLHRNKVQNLKPFTFRRLGRLQELHLYNNRISNISNSLFDGLMRLKRLYLHDNQIQAIKSDAFVDLLSLEILHLMKNNISSVKYKALLPLKSLSELRLDVNSLKHIPSALLTPHLLDLRLNIAKNPLICSCQLLNELKQLQYKFKELIPTARQYKKTCTNITALCEEQRNFALGMRVSNNCFRDRFASVQSIADGNVETSAVCPMFKGPLFYLLIPLPGVIMVTDIAVCMEPPRHHVRTTSIDIQVGDQLRNKHTQCHNVTLSSDTGVRSVNVSCLGTQPARDIKISIKPLSCGTETSSCNEEGLSLGLDDGYKFFEIVVNGYNLNEYNIWSSWSTWGHCSAGCGNGHRVRNQTCTQSTSLKCLLPDTVNQREQIRYEKGSCNLKPCVQSEYLWAIGAVAGVFILVISGIIFWYRKVKMVTYFDGLRPNPNFEMDPNRTLLEQIEELPYDLHWEFPRYDVRFGSVLGEGNFGRVWLAKAKGIKAFNPRDHSDLSSRAKLAKLQDQRVDDYFTTVTESWALGDCDTTRHYDVAVKTLKECATPQHKMDLASELKLLIYMGPNPHIVNILASCTIRGDLWLIMEFCDHGCLKSFLSDRRQLFTPSWSKQSADITYEICFFDLLRMCEQIVKGLMFLHFWNVVHRDLSARNILVDANFNLKIADFGLARSDGFVATVDDIMPIKWTSLESLLRHEYTLKSDIWSIGILFWEIFALGEMPYPGMVSRDVIQQLKQGHRMSSPDHCPQEVWRIISSTWDDDPELRPTATELFEQLDELKTLVCSAPEGEYYGLGGENGEVGTVQGPTLDEIIERKTVLELEDEEVTRHIEDFTDTLESLADGDHEKSGPSMMTCDQFRSLETENCTLSNENQSLKIENEKIEFVTETLVHQRGQLTDEMKSSVEENFVNNFHLIDTEEEKSNGKGLHEEAHVDTDEVTESTGL